MNIMEDFKKGALGIIAQRVDALEVYAPKVDTDAWYLRMAHNTYLRVHIRKKQIIVSMYDSEGALVKGYSWAWRSSKDFNAGISKINLALTGK